ncbi:MAG: HlyD family secretion protein [Bacillota bacterium]|nr:HlyD family secretion protein [Bacillota bacterium]
MVKEKSNNKGKVLAGLGIVIVLAVAGFGGNWYIDQHNYVTTDNAKVSGDIINASPKVAGKIADIKVSNGMKVKKGDVLFTLETDLFQAQVNQAQAAVNVAKAQLDKATGGARGQEIAAAQAGYDQAQAAYSAAVAGKDSAQTLLNDAESKYDDLVNSINTNSEITKDANGNIDMKQTSQNIATDLKKLGLNNDEYGAHYTTAIEGIQQLVQGKSQLETEIDQLKGQVNTADAQAKAAKAAADGANDKLNLTTAGASDKDLAIIEDQVKAAQAALDLANLNLSNAEVKAATDGTVVQVSGHVGDLVSPGQAVLSLVDFSKLQVTAYVLENDLQRVDVNEPVKLEIDSFPGVTFDGKVTEKGLATASTFSLFSTDNASGNFTKVSQRIPVKVSIDAKGYAIIPGMSVTAKIKTTK